MVVGKTKGQPERLQEEWGGPRSWFGRIWDVPSLSWGRAMVPMV